MPIIHCPSCDDPVEIEADWYGRRIACPNCDHKFTPRRPGREDGRDDDRDDRPRRARDRDDDREDDRPRRRSRRYDDDPPKKKGNTVLWVVLILLLIFVVLPCATCIGIGIWGNTAKQSFDGPWSDAQVGTNGEVTASFPKTPTSRFPAISGSTAAEMKGFSTVNDANEILDVELGVGFVEYPSGFGDPLATHYADIRKEAERLFMDNPLTGIPSPQRETTTTVNGYPAKEATYADDDGGFVLRVIHVNDRPPGSNVRLVVVVAGGHHLKPEDKQKFLNSVKIGKK